MSGKIQLYNLDLDLDFRQLIETRSLCMILKHFHLLLTTRQFLKIRHLFPWLASYLHPIHLVPPGPETIPHLLRLQELQINT